MTLQLPFRLVPPAAQAAEVLASPVGVAKVGVVASPVAAVRAVLAQVQAAVKAALSAGRVAASQHLPFQLNKVGGFGPAPIRRFASRSVVCSARYLAGLNRSLKNEHGY